MGKFQTTDFKRKSACMLNPFQQAKRELDEIFERSIHVSKLPLGGRVVRGTCLKNSMCGPAKVTSLKDEDFANVLGPGWKQHCGCNMCFASCGRGLPLDVSYTRQHPTKIDFSSPGLRTVPGCTGLPAFLRVSATGPECSLTGDGRCLKGDRYQLDTLEGPSGGLLHPQLRKHRVQLVDAPKMV